MKRYNNEKARTACLPVRQTGPRQRNENWIKRVDSEGYEIRNLGNPANDPRSSIFFDMELNSVTW